MDSSIKQYAFDFKENVSIPPSSINLDAKMEEASPGRLSGLQRANYGDKMLYIYTSGTTGLPKAVNILIKINQLDNNLFLLTKYFRLSFVTLGK